MNKQIEIFNAEAKSTLTPMMQQYLAIKSQYEDCLLFYRMGDFYELFFNDAVDAAEILDIVLTKRGKHDGSDIPMCGVPSHSYELYLEKLIKSGRNVAICEQLERPEEAKKRGYKAVVKRDVVRIVTPGTILEENLLSARNSNYLAAVNLSEGRIFTSLVDVASGEFFVFATSTAGLLAELSRFSINEIIVSEKVFHDASLKNIIDGFGKSITTRANTTFDTKRGEARLAQYFNVHSLDGFANFNASEISVMGGLLEYVEHTQKSYLPRLSKPTRLQSSNFLSIDPSTRRNLELEQCINPDSKFSLLTTIDQTITAGGARLLRLYLSSPLTNAQAINKRLDNVECFVNNVDLKDNIRQILRSIPDLDRSLSRVWVRKGTPKDLAQLRDGLRHSLRVAELIMFGDAQVSVGVSGLASRIGNFINILEKLSAAIVAEPSLNIKDGGFITNGYSPELDNFYDVKNNSKHLVEKLRDKYRAQTGINNLKINFNNVLGYFIDVTPSNADKIEGEEFKHRQTLGSSIRYSSEELNKLQADIFSAEQKITEIEARIFDELCQQIINESEAISETSQALSGLDIYCALANIALQMNYVRPIIDDSREFNIEGGRHPIVEKSLRDRFIPNMCNLAPEQSIWLITGPNMAGKSTFLRQNAIICIMAQMGGFVPATSAHIGVVDKLFSRIGAADDISRGQSTFMVEMVETANILNNATDRSLIILDEIGRGTSTYDGLAIAWSIVENIHNVIKARTMFATHYHELTDLESKLENTVCYTVKVKEWEGKIIFQHEVIKGKADRSYGIHVASLAGLPQSIIKRSDEILSQIESKDKVQISSPPANTNTTPDYVSDIKAKDIDLMTPREAFDFLYELKNKIG